MINNIGQEDDLCVREPDKQSRSLDAEMVTYINLDSKKSIIFTTLESNMSQRHSCIV